MTIWGPGVQETAYAFSALSAAEKLLDAVIENRVTAAHVRELSSGLQDVRDAAVMCAENSFQQRCDELLETDWDAAIYDPKCHCFSVESGGPDD